MPNGGGGTPPGKGNGGIIGCAPGFEFNIGFELDCPSAAYELVIESITDCAFSCPISASTLVNLGGGRSI
jgi:hypothetical protein